AQPVPNQDHWEAGRRERHFAKKGVRAAAEAGALRRAPPPPAAAPSSDCGNSQKPATPRASDRPHAASASPAMTGSAGAPATKQQLDERYSAKLPNRFSLPGPDGSRASASRRVTYPTTPCPPGALQHHHFPAAEPAGARSAGCPTFISWWPASSSCPLTRPVSEMASILPWPSSSLVTMVKQGYEDLLRHLEDRKVNKTLVWGGGGSGERPAGPARAAARGRPGEHEHSGECPRHHPPIWTAKTNLKTFWGRRGHQVAAERGLLCCRTAGQGVCEQPKPDLYSFAGRAAQLVKPQAHSSIPLNAQRKCPAARRGAPQIAPNSA
uniref:Tubulin tyrosine ligase like 5 n=1 Tax=Macrostomum lignano TaxID=282301 RepID=A0A1I8FHS2_9PLAT